MVPITDRNQLTTGSAAYLKKPYGADANKVYMGICAELQRPYLQGLGTNVNKVYILMEHCSVHGTFAAEGTRVSRK